MKAYTDLEQSKKLAEILPIESADMYYTHGVTVPDVMTCSKQDYRCYTICWSLTALLNYIKDKCGYFELVYISNTLEGKANELKRAYRLSTDVYDIYEVELIDACVAMVEKLNELKLYDYGLQKEIQRDNVGGTKCNTARTESIASTDGTPNCL